MAWLVEYRNLSPRTGKPWQSYKRKFFATEAEARAWAARNGAGQARRRVAVDGPKRTYVAVGPGGLRVTRTSSHPYTHAAFTFDARPAPYSQEGWYLQSFDTSAALAERAVATAIRHDIAVRGVVVPVDVEGGQARRKRAAPSLLRSITRRRRR